MKPSLRACVVLLLSLLSLLSLLGFAAPSQAAVQKTSWACWLHDDGVQAVCKVLGTADESRLPHVTPDLQRARAQTPREFLQVIRERPADMQGQQVFVPLHTVPWDELSVELLVKAVLCGPLANCDARYQHDMSKLFAHTPELFVDMNDLLWEGRPV